LDGSKLGELTLPVRMNTESFHVTKLIKIRLHTAIVSSDWLDGTIFLPEDGKLTRSITLVDDLEVKGYIKGE